MKNPSGELFAGIDSGGTKCSAVLTDKNLKKQFFVTVPSRHYSDTGADIIADYLIQAVKLLAAKSETDFSLIKGIGIGIAGARTAQQQEEIKTALTHKSGYRNFLVTSDTQAALKGALGDEDGFVLICGTGSVLFGVSGNTVHRTGGWGKILGDQGSGYWIAREALAETVKVFDSGKKAGKFHVLLKKKFGITGDNIISKVYHEKFDIQKIAPLVIECASKNDAMCRKIINKSSEELTVLVENAVRKTKTPEKLKLCLSGSIIANDNYYSGKLKKELKRKFGKKVIIASSAHSPETGAAMLAMKKFV